MYFKYLRFLLPGVAACLILATLHQVNATESETTSSLRDIPGITADDMFPQGCVDCHLNFTDKNMDTRISTSLAKWEEGAESKLLEKAQAATPKETILTGRHPAAKESLADIPKACIECHKSMSPNAPVFSQMVHLIHLMGGRDNHYMTIFRGECTYCHKLDPASGKWLTPSGSEQ